MFAYAENPIQKKTNSGKVIQRKADVADKFRTIAFNILRVCNSDKISRTVAVSNNYYAVSPKPDSRDQSNADSKSERRSIVSGIHNASPEENHAERKLLRQESNLTEIGVSNTICNTCMEKLRKTPTLEHAADLEGVHAIRTPTPHTRTAPYTPFPMHILPTTPVIPITSLTPTLTHTIRRGDEPVAPARQADEKVGVWSDVKSDVISKLKFNSLASRKHVWLRFMPIDILIKKLELLVMIETDTPTAFNDTKSMSISGWVYFLEALVPKLMSRKVI